VIDFTSSLYLGMRHDTMVVPPWRQLTTGRPAALAEAPQAGQVAAGLAGLIGVPAATLAPSTMHAFWDLFVVLGARQIFVDAGTYPIARWGAERARCAGASAQAFRHHDPADLRRAAMATAGPGLAVLTDGLCPGCGGVAPVGDYLDAVRSCGGIVVVDDTQALGVLGLPAPGHPYGAGGGGITRWAGLRDPRLLIVASLAKGLGVPVAVVAGHQAAVRRYEDRAETRVHCSPPSDAHLGAAGHALRDNQRRGDELRARLGSLVARFRGRLRAEGVMVTAGLFPVQTIAPRGRADLQDVHQRLGELGVRAVLHRPRCEPRLALSFIVTAAHHRTEVDRAARAVGIALSGGPVGRPGRIPIKVGTR
jgi:8-amino-7-oxononanoate synthase